MLYIIQDGPHRPGARFHIAPTRGHGRHSAEAIDARTATQDKTREGHSERGVPFAGEGQFAGDDPMHILWDERRNGQGKPLRRKTGAVIMIDRDDAWTARRDVFLTEDAQGRLKPGNGGARVVLEEAGAR